MYVLSSDLQHLEPDIEETLDGDDVPDGEIETITSDIVVLGAGMAGIAAAKRLSEHGVDNIVVVEGANRIGGRVKDVPFGGIRVEVGANWVHFSNMKKTEVNPIELMVKDAGLNFIEDDYQDFMFRYRGKENIFNRGI